MTSGRRNENCAGRQEMKLEKKEMVRMTENNNAVKELKDRCEQLKAEVQIYHDAAALYGIDPMTMLTLAKSQIKTCADNIRLMEKNGRYTEYVCVCAENPDSKRCSDGNYSL